MKIEQQRAAFEAWQANQNPKGYPAERQAFEAGWQAALASPEVQRLRDSLQKVVDAADGKGWDQLDPGLEKQRAALAAMEEQK